MVNYFITVWMALNCIGTQLGTLIVPRDQCVEPKFGLAFRTNGSYVTVSSTCDQTTMLNTIRCGVSEDCCHVPEGLSINMTETDLPLNPGNTRLKGLPQATTGRTFVCVEQIL